MKHIVLFFLFLGIGVTYAQISEKLSITVKDTKDISIYGVYVIKQPGNLLLTITDENGTCEINPSSCTPHDKIIFYSMGFISDTLTIAQLKEAACSVRLRENFYKLKEVTIYNEGPTLPEIIKKATEQITKTKHGGRHWQPRYCGEGTFTKLTTCNGHPVQVRRENGIFITSGNARKEANGYNWDMAYDLYFMPEYSARSFDFQNNGQDTLKLKYVSMSHEARWNLNYDVTCFPKIYNTMRALYLFGPLFSKPKYFHYKLIDENDTSYVVSFATDKQYYPNPNKVLCRGIVEIDKNTFHLKQIHAEHFGDVRFEFKMNKSYQHPYQKKLNVQFAYFQDGECYIQNCDLETQWLYETSYSKRIASNEGCPRPHAARDQLIEKENWHCHEYHPVSKIVGISNKQLENTLCAIHFTPAGKYDKKIFDALPATNEFREAEHLLGKFVDIHTQYERNSNQPYLSVTSNCTSEKARKRINVKNYLIKELKKQLEK